MYGSVLGTGSGWWVYSMFRRILTDSWCWLPTITSASLQGASGSDESITAQQRAGKMTSS